MTVYTYVGTLPQPIKQVDVVEYFATRPEGPLIFTQSTLSGKLQRSSEMEARVHSNPNALSSKRPRIVTRPEVDRALWLWALIKGYVVFLTCCGVFCGVFRRKSKSPQILAVICVAISPQVQITTSICGDLFEFGSKGRGAL